MLFDLVNESAFQRVAEAQGANGEQTIGRSVMHNGFVAQTIHQLAQAGFFARHGEQTHNAYPRSIGQRLEYVLGLNVY